MPTNVDLAVVTAGAVSSQWWRNLMADLLSIQAQGDILISGVRVVSSALPDHNKNAILESPKEKSFDQQMKRRHGLTDENRSAASKAFLSGKADWIWWVDDDTTPPPNALPTLLSLRREFVGGIYFLGREPYNPIAYVRGDDGFYKALWKFAPGDLMQVDAIGMGCTLIHRSVYQKILDGHREFVRPNGSLMALPEKSVKLGGSKVEFQDREAFTGFVAAGVYQLPVYPKPEDDLRPFPFYAMEYGRTEDYHFCELAENVGVKPWLDTSIVCDHWKLKAVNKATHKMMSKMLRVEVDENGTKQRETGPEREAVAP
jgi:hypothetical protein